MTNNLKKKKRRKNRELLKDALKFTPSYSKGGTFRSTLTPSGSKMKKKNERAIVALCEFASKRTCFKCHERGHIASECPNKVVSTTTQHAIIDDEEQRYNFVVGKVEDLENEFDEEIQPENKYNMIAI